MSKSAIDEHGAEHARAGLRMHRYSTRDVAPSERHEAWRQRNWPSFARLYETRPLGPFAVESCEVQLDSISVMDVSIAGQRYERTPAMLGDSKPDLLAVQFMIEGEAQGLMGEAAFRHVAGSLLFVDMARTSRHESTQSRTVTLALPREAALGIGIDPAAAHGQVVAGSAAALFGNHVRHIIKAAATLPVARERDLARSLLDLLAVAADGLHRRGGYDAPRSRASGLRARAEIQSRLGAATLKAADLARRLGISRSTLHRLFAEEGGVQAYIRERRLQEALRALQQEEYDKSIGAIAERFGFSDASHLSRLFRARFGVTPSQVRAGFPPIASQMDANGALPPVGNGGRSEASRIAGTAR